jgi:hypothetical protein
LACRLAFRTQLIHRALEQRSNPLLSKQLFQLGVRGIGGDDRVVDRDFRRSPAAFLSGRRFERVHHHAIDANTRGTCEIGAACVEAREKFSLERRREEFLRPVLLHLVHSRSSAGECS